MVRTEDLNSLTGEDAVRAARAKWRTAQLVEAATRLLQRSGLESMSMQELADEASVSIGMIYRYFKSKEDVLVAIIMDVLEAFQERVPAAMAAAGDDPVERLAAGFHSYCGVIDDRRHAAVLTYQRSKALSADALARIETLEVETTGPLREAITAGIAAGLLEDVDRDLAVYNLVLMAHGWALKHWYFSKHHDLDDYVAQQTAILMRSLVLPSCRSRYTTLLNSSKRLVDPRPGPGA